MLDNMSVLIGVVCLQCVILCLFVGFFFYFFLSLPFVFDPKLL